MLKLKGMINLVSRSFGRLQIKGDKKPKEKEKTFAMASGDEKFIKLSRKEDNGAKVQAERLEREARINMSKQHDLRLDQKITPKIVEKATTFITTHQIDLVENPLQTYDALRSIMKENIAEKEIEFEQNETNNRQKFDVLNVNEWSGKSFRELKQQRAYFNPERFVNEKFDVKPIFPSSPMSTRCGSLGYKIGMTSIFDKWGHMIPLSVIQLDRAQILMIKEKGKDNVDSVQVGCGERSIRRLKKPQIGHFMKANVPPKMHMTEFKISPENRLPVGYMIGVRHFTIGQFIDVESKSKGKGFCGVMKKWNFKGMPASHGCSVTHRCQGSTGNHQDPGRVWKKLKMAGRMGNDTVVVRKLQVYKIDYERSLIYVKGSIAGPAGRLVKVFDSHFHWKNNIGLLNYPTFIYEKGKKYANIIQIEPPQADPTENWLHENAVLSDDEEEVAAVSEVGASEGSK